MIAPIFFCLVRRGDSNRLRAASHASSNRTSRRFRHFCLKSSNPRGRLFIDWSIGCLTLIRLNFENPIYACWDHIPPSRFVCFLEFSKIFFLEIRKESVRWEYGSRTHIWGFGN